MRFMSSLRARIERRLPVAVAFRKAREGVAAVEFAILMPLMVLMFFGTVELTQGFAAARKLDYLSRDLADLAAQSTASTLQTSDLTTIFGVASSVFYPFSNAQMSLTGIIFQTGTDNLEHAYTDWSVAASTGGTARPCGELQRTSVAGNAPPAIPDALFPAAGSAATTMIAADVSYTYLPMIGSTFMAIGSAGTKLGSSTVASIPMQRTAYMQPRALARVHYVSPCSPPAGVTFKIP
jgi:Flp pilus assembly protein TadG